MVEQTLHWFALLQSLLHYFLYILRLDMDV